MQVLHPQYTDTGGTQTQHKEIKHFLAYLDLEEEEEEEECVKATVSDVTRLTTVPIH